MRQKGMILALILMFVPLALILAITVSNVITFGSGYSTISQHKARAFYLAESGINIAYRWFQAENFSADTLAQDEDPRKKNDPELLGNIAPELGFEYDPSGWYVWRWKPGDPVDSSYTRSGLDEEIRFRIIRPKHNTFKIDCRATVGSYSENQSVEGDIISMLNWVTFDNGDLSDFTTSTSDTISGQIHANGDLYLVPYNTTGLNIASITEGFTAVETITRAPDEDEDPDAQVTETTIEVADANGAVQDLARLLGSNFVVMENSFNPNLTISTSDLTSGGKIIRYKDPWGIVEDGGTVTVINSKTGKTGILEGKEQGNAYQGKGKAFDSYNKDWNGQTSQNALGRWDAAVADSKMGVQQRSAALAETLKPGGFYDNRAGAHIDGSTNNSWIKNGMVSNQSEARNVNVKEIDLSKMAKAGAWPENGLLYSSEPLKIVGGQELAADLTIVSSSTVYVQGDFNKNYPTEEALNQKIVQRKNAAIITPARIYKLTSSFDNDKAAAPHTLFNLLSGEFKATDAPLYPGDPNNTLEMNAAFIDGVPATSARAWVNDPANTRYVEGFKLNVIGRELGRKVKQIPDSDIPGGATAGSINVAYAQSEALLEDMQNVRVIGTGAVGHLRIAEMADFENSNVDEGRTPWLVQTSYIPSKQKIDGKVGREFTYDPKLVEANDEGALTGAPFNPMTGRWVRWSRGGSL